MNNALISIIVPIYNSERYLKDCLESIINQSYKNLEIILINDGSKDKSGEICDEIANSDLRIKVFHKNNEGVSVARNYGLEKSNGEYIYFSDSDDILEEDLIYELVEALEKTSSDIAMCSYYIFQGINKKYFSSEKLFNGNYSQKEFVKIMLKNECYSGYLWNKLFKKTLLNGIFFKKELKICEDEVFCLDYIKKITSGVIIDSSLYGYRNNPYSTMKQGLNENMLSNILSRQYVLDCLIEERYDSDLIKKRYHDLLFLYSNYYWHILFVKISNKKYWLKIMKDGYKKYYSKEIIWKEWTLKQKIIILGMKIRMIFF